MRIPDVPCTTCHGPTRVIPGFSKPTDRGIRRKRICGTCGKPFFTYQRKGLPELPGTPEDEKTRPVHAAKKHAARLEGEQEMSIGQRRRLLIRLAILNAGFETFPEDRFDEVVLREAKKIREMKVGVE